MTGIPKPEKPPTPPPVTVTTTRAAEVVGVDGRPALRISESDGEVKLTLLPTNGNRRSAIRLVDLADAVQRLGTGG